MHLKLQFLQALHNDRMKLGEVCDKFDSKHYINYV